MGTAWLWAFEQGCPNTSWLWVVLRAIAEKLLSLRNQRHHRGWEFEEQQSKNKGSELWACSVRKVLTSRKTWVLLPVFTCKAVWWYTLVILMLAELRQADARGSMESQPKLSIHSCVHNHTRVHTCIHIDMPICTQKRKKPKEGKKRSWGK